VMLVASSPLGLAEKWGNPLPVVLESTARDPDGEAVEGFALIGIKTVVDLDSPERPLFVFRRKAETLSLLCSSRSRVLIGIRHGRREGGGVPVVLIGTARASGGHSRRGVGLVGIRTRLETGSLERASFGFTESRLFLCALLIGTAGTVCGIRHRRRVVVVW
jgi:hypothetical protein